MLRWLFGVKEGVREYLRDRPEELTGGYMGALNNLNKFIRDEESRETK